MACSAEVHAGDGAGGLLLAGRFAERREELLTRFGGQVQTLYLDPPFFTGQRFVHRQRAGEAGWRSGKPLIELPAYDDRWADEADFLAMMREALELAHALLSPDGSLFLHIDARMHAPLRLMLDDIFGARCFANEIIWAYQSGGRSLKHFSRKHDIILFYRKTPGAYFNIRAVGRPRAEAQHNHMRRSVDADGRAYRAIVSQGREYRYYDDEPIYPGDVWDDVSHLQQKDPQRTGYDTQKPLNLLRRIILCSSRPGDLVMDFFAGSGTTALAAAALGRRFVAVDSAESSLAVMRARLLGRSMRIEAPCSAGTPLLEAELLPGIGFWTVHPTGYAIEEGLCPLTLPGTQAIDQLSVGYLRDGVFHAYANAARSKASPALPPALDLPALDGRLALLTVDVLGRRMTHCKEDNGDGE
jgi:DNA modification methylase